MTHPSMLQQQKKMYKGKRLEESSIIHKSFGNSLLAQTTNQVFEREIDNYTRLLEQDKRKFFRVQENRNQVAKEYTKKAKELQSLKSKTFTSQMVKMKGKVKILENELDQTINSYNQVLASNKKLKGQIDELRKEKLNQRDVMGKITSQIAEYSHLIVEEQALAAKRKSAIEKDKEVIISIKNKNQSEAKMFRDEFSVTQDNLGSSKAGHTLMKHRGEMEPKGQCTDTLPLVRFRMRHLIARNKERVKVIDSYRKTMEAIRKGFEDIKEESGINDLEEITSTFLKQEQQNHFIYEYIGKLNRQIEDLTEETQSLKELVHQQSEVNHGYIQKLGATPRKTQLKRAKEELENKWKEQIAALDDFLVMANSELITLNSHEEVSRFNLTQQLAKLEQQIDKGFSPKQDLFNATGGFREDITKYTKVPPNCGDELKENREEKLMDGQKLRQFASDFWEKRRGKPDSK